MMVFVLAENTNLRCVGEDIDVSWIDLDNKLDLDRDMGW